MGQSPIHMAQYLPKTDPSFWTHTPHLPYTTSPKPYGLRSDSSPVTMTALASHPRPAPSSHTQPPRHLCRDLLCQSNPSFRSSNCPLVPNQRLTQTDTPKAEAFWLLKEERNKRLGLAIRLKNLVERKRAKLKRGRERQDLKIKRGRLHNPLSRLHRQDTPVRERSDPDSFSYLSKSRRHPSIQKGTWAFPPPEAWVFQGFTTDTRQFAVFRGKK